MTTAMWTMLGGEKIAIRDMSDSHLKNALAMLRRKGFITRDALHDLLCCAGPNGEMAQDAFNSGLERVKVSREMGDLEAEAQRRGLE